MDNDTTPTKKRPRGRPRGKVTPDKIAHTIRFDAETYAAIGAFARASGYSINIVINRILEEFLEADWAVVDLGARPEDGRQSSIVKSSDVVLIKWPQRSPALRDTGD